MRQLQKAVTAFILIICFVLCFSGCADSGKTPALPWEIGLYQEYLQRKRPMTTSDGQEYAPELWYEEEYDITYSYLDLNHDGICELLYRVGDLGSLEIASCRENEVIRVPTPFYSAANGEYISSNYEITMVDTLHEGRNDYSVYRLNENCEMELVVFFTKLYYNETCYYKCCSDENKYKGELTRITKDEYWELVNQYMNDKIELKWNQFKAWPSVDDFKNDAAILEANRRNHQG